MSRLIPVALPAALAASLVALGAQELLLLALQQFLQHPLRPQPQQQPAQLGLTPELRPASNTSCI